MARKAKVRTRWRPVMMGGYILSLLPTWCIVCLDKKLLTFNNAEEERDDNKETWVEAVQDGGDDEEDGVGEDGRDGVEEGSDGDGRQPNFHVLHNRVTPRYQNYFSSTIAIRVSRLLPRSFTTITTQHTFSCWTVTHIRV